jgi:molybdopterin-guanine dinucleotide biosynthesis protein A
VTRPSGILLAGGASRRFGRSKLIEPLGGAPLFHHPLRALARACAEVIVVLSPQTPDLELPSGVSMVRFVRDAVAYEGPLAGVHTGLAHVAGAHAIAAGADMPGLRPELLEFMAGRLISGGRDAVVLSDASGPRPLPAALAVAPAHAMAGELLASGERRLRSLIARLRPETVPEETWSAYDRDGAWRRDVNVVEDLEGETR